MKAFLSATALLALLAAPALAQDAPTIAAASTPKPSGALGAFLWGAPVGSASALAFGFAGNLWFTPFLSVGAYGTSAAYGGSVGSLTDVNLEAKLKFYQSGVDPGSFALTGDLGAKWLSAGGASTLSPKVGLIGDLVLPAGTALQGRLDASPWLTVGNTPVVGVDYKASFAWSPWHGFGLEAGWRGQSLGPLSRNGPFAGVGYLF